jgi:hypothetical protein
MRQICTLGYIARLHHAQGLVGISKSSIAPDHVWHVITMRHQTIAAVAIITSDRRIGPNSGPKPFRGGPEQPREPRHAGIGELEISKCKILMRLDQFSGRTCLVAALGKRMGGPPRGSNPGRERLVPSRIVDRRLVVEHFFYDRNVDVVQSQGWTRADVYHLVQEILYSPASEFSEYTLDQLGEVEAGRTGYCDPKSIIRFPNEPSDEAELVAYVRGHRAGSHPGAR